MVLGGGGGGGGTELVPPDSNKMVPVHIVPGSRSGVRSAPLGQRSIKDGRLGVPVNIH
jgi:hypothetical protein